MTRDVWLQAIEEAGIVVHSDPDALTLKEFMAKYGFTRHAATKHLKMLVDTGKATRTRKVVVDTAGRNVMVPAYALVKK